MATPQYIKPSAVKAIIPPATNTGVDINTQVGNIKKQYGNMSTEQLYGAMLNVKPPAQQDILQSVGTQYGYNDRIAGLREQAGEIQRQMLSDQSALFAATNPDGTPVDPRVKVSQFQENLTRGTQRLQQIQKIQDVYASEMQTLAGAIADQYKAKAQDTQTAIQFMQQLNQEKNSDRNYNLQKEQFDFQKSQAGTPKWTSDGAGGFYDSSSNVNPNLQKMASSTNASELLSVGDGTVIPGKYGKSEINSTGGLQCGEYVNKITGLGLGDSYQSKLDKMNIKVNSSSNKAPEGTGVGNTVVWKPSNDPVWSKYGHTGIIVGEEGNNWIVKSSNLRGDGAISTDPVPKSKIDGYNNNAKINQTAPSALEDIQYKNYLKSFLPSTLKDSAKEIEALQKDIKVYQQAGLTMQQAGLASRGFNVKDPENLDTATQILNVFNNMKVQPAGFEAKVSNFLNAGDKKGLSNYITTALDREIADVQGTEATSTPQMMLLNDNTNNLVGLIEKNKDKIGAFDGNVEQFISKFKGTPEFQEIKTLLQGMQASQRKFFAGSAITPTEMEALRDFIGGVQTMDANNLVTQLETVREMAQKKYDAQRANYLGEVSVGDPTGSVSQTQSSGNKSIPGLPPGRFQSQTGTGVGRWQQSNQ